MLSIQLPDRLLWEIIHYCLDQGNTNIGKVVVDALHAYEPLQSFNRNRTIEERSTQAVNKAFAAVEAKYGENLSSDEMLKRVAQYWGFADWADYEASIDSNTEELDALDDERL